MVSKVVMRLEARKETGREGSQETQKQVKILVFFDESTRNKGQIVLQVSVSGWYEAIL